MFIKETPWESRNLGVNGVEFYINTDDSPKEIETFVQKDRMHDYQVAHLPVNRSDLVYALANSGFYFAETKFALFAKLKELPLPNVFLKYKNLLTYRLAETQEFDWICSSIEKGIFDTDKVSLDPWFGKEKAGRRYALWARDEVSKRTSKPFIVKYQNESIGFFILKTVSDRVGESFLAGMFPGTGYHGLGFSVLHFPMLQAQKEGKQKIITGVSSNNPASLRMHLSLGYEIDVLEYIMVKHLP